MDEVLDSLAQRYALRRKIKLRERLGFGIHGTVFAAVDNTKPGFFAVKFHREERPFERECRVYQRLREERTTRILGFNVPQLLRIDQEFRAIEMTIVRSPFLLDFADALLDEAPDFSEDVLRQWEEDKMEIFGERWPELLAFSQRYRRSALICSILIQAIFPFLKRFGETKSVTAASTRLCVSYGEASSVSIHASNRLMMRKGIVVRTG